VEKPAFVASYDECNERASLLCLYRRQSFTCAYIGFTGNIESRILQHKNAVYEGFSQEYRCHRLVWLEQHTTALNAIAREKQIKRWNRTKKLILIKRENPTWIDLAEQWGKPYKFYDASDKELPSAPKQ